jgi:hypothetical protein
MSRCSPRAAGWRLSPQATLAMPGSSGLGDVYRSGAVGVQRLNYAAEFGERTGPRGQLVLNPQGAHDGAGMDAAELERAGKAHQILSLSALITLPLRRTVKAGSNPVGSKKPNFWE